MGLECGLVIEAKYIKKVKFPSTEVMELGNYFEYIATGSKTRDGRIPEPVYLKSGKLNVAYQRIIKQKENYDRILKEHGFKILEIDYVFNNKLFSGIADVIAEKDGVKCIVDIKTTGLIDDKWQEFGWADESIEHKDQLLVQAIHYTLLAKEEWKVDNVPFYFFIFSNKNDVDCKIFEIIIDEDTYTQHLNNMSNALIYLEESIKSGWKANPSLKRCNSCFLKDKCKSATKVPLIKKVYI